METPTLKQIVGNGKTATILYIRKGYVYYILHLEQWWMFPIELADLGDATLNESERAITLMRYIRKALEDGTFVRATPPQYIADLQKTTAG